LALVGYLRLICAEVIIMRAMCRPMALTIQKKCRLALTKRLKASNLSFTQKNNKKMKFHHSA
jgi:hypothetical protein